MHKGRDMRGPIEGRNASEDVMGTLGNRNKTVAVVGAAVGFALFLGVALLPALVYGGYAGLLLAGGIFGTPVPATLAARGLVGFGMVLAVFAAASVFTVAGAAVASFLAHLAPQAAPGQKKALARAETK
jgi:hypothetical protein